MRGSRVVVMVAALALLTSGCWLEAGQSAGRGGFNPFESQITAANVSQLGIAWQHTLTGPIDESLISPSASTAYVPGSGVLTAFDLVTGASPWSNTSMPTTFQPVLVAGQIDVAAPGGSACLLKHLDPATGNIASTDTYGEPPGEAPGAQSVACGPGVPLGSGRVVVPWSQVAIDNHFTCSPQPTWREFTGLISIPGYEIDAELSPVCSSTQPPLPPMTYGTPTLVDGLVVAPAGEDFQSLVALHPDTGATAWSAFGGGGSVNGPVVALPNGDLAYTTQAGDLRVHDGTTGALKWTAHLDTSLTLPPAATGTTVFVATPSGVLDALPIGGCNASTCNPIWHATLASPASARPSIGGNVVYVGSTNGSVTAFAAGGCNASTCSSLWSGSTGSEITGAPAIGHGHVVVGSANGTVTAFALAPQT